MVLRLSTSTSVTLEVLGITCSTSSIAFNSRTKRKIQYFLPYTKNWWNIVLKNKLKHKINIPDGDIPSDINAEWLWSFLELILRISEWLFESWVFCSAKFNITLALLPILKFLDFATKNKILTIILWLSKYLSTNFNAKLWQ